MTIYVLDDSLQSPANLQKMAIKAARNWKALVGHDQDPVFVTWDARNGFRQVTEVGFESIPQLEDGIVILHRPSDQAIQAIATAREGGLRTVAIQVRGNPYDGQPSERDWFYYVRTEVDIEDSGFSERFKRFWSDFVKSGGHGPKFSLLEPTSVPEPLLAYALAVQYRLNVPNVTALCAAAEASYQKLRAYAKSLFDKNQGVSFPEAGVPEIDEIRKSKSDLGDASGIRFKAVRNLIDLLREDL